MPCWCYDAGLELEPQLVKLTAAAASMALEHVRLQAEVQAQLEQVRASRARIVEAGDAERAGWSAICTTARSSGWSR